MHDKTEEWDFAKSSPVIEQVTPGKFEARARTRSMRRSIAEEYRQWLLKRAIDYQHKAAWEAQRSVWGRQFLPHFLSETLRAAAAIEVADQQWASAHHAAIARGCLLAALRMQEKKED